MRARYVFRDGQFVERKSGEPMTAPDRIASPMLMRDVHYKSPLSMKEITSRSQRREEMKIHNVREVDPSEHTPVYRSRKWAERMKGDHDPAAGQPKFEEGTAPFKRLSKAEIPKRVARTIAR